MADNSVQVSELRKSYGDNKAVDGVSFAVEEGEVYGILGPNGAGKSTTVEVLTGQTGRDSGNVNVLGIDPEDKPVELRRKLGILPEREDPPSFLTGDEYMDFVSDVRGAEIDKEQWVDRLRLEGKMDELTRDLSKGERQKLMIAQAFFHEPELVFIDEPLTNLDPVIQEEVKQIIADYGGTVILCTHNVELAEEVCDRVLFMKEGRAAEKLEDVADVKERFLDDFDY